MSKVSIFDREWIDLVFEGRNKQYGAYQLRKENPKTTIIALFSGIALIGALVSLPLIINQFKPDTDLSDKTTPTLPDAIIFEEKVKPPKPKEPVIEQPVEKTAAAPKSNKPTIKFKPLVPVANPTTDVPKLDDFKDADPGNKTSEGGKDGTIVIGHDGGEGPKDSKGTATTGEDSGDDNPVAAVLLDESPMFPGGLKKFGEKVIDNFDPSVTENAMTLRVLVSFIVEKDGSMTDIKVLRDPGHGMGKEAVKALRAIKTKWTPGKKNGKPVRTAYTLPITLNVK